jgi:hypothetical protein
VGGGLPAAGEGRRKRTLARHAPPLHLAHSQNTHTYWRATPAR